MHEASLHDLNCFITLTYKDEFLPPFGSLDYAAPVLFMKRLRKRFGDGIRSYGCAEYGSLLRRPHYHLLVFNHDFCDKKLWKNARENSLYRSQELEKLWPFGHSTVGSVTFESAAYVARYATKTITGEASKKHYERFDEVTGEVYSLLPEKSVCVSRRKAIGREWYERYGQFVRDHDKVILRGKSLRPSKYYDRLFDLIDPDSLRRTKDLRRRAGDAATRVISEADRENFSGFRWTHGSAAPKHRLTVMEEVAELKFQELKRSLEDG